MLDLIVGKKKGKK